MSCEFEVPKPPALVLTDGRFLTLLCHGNSTQVFTTRYVDKKHVVGCSTWLHTDHFRPCGLLTADLAHAPGVLMWNPVDDVLTLAHCNIDHCGNVAFVRLSDDLLQDTGVRRTFVYIDDKSVQWILIKAPDNNDVVIFAISDCLRVTARVSVTLPECPQLYHLGDGRVVIYGVGGAICVQVDMTMVFGIVTLLWVFKCPAVRIVSRVPEGALLLTAGIGVVCLDLKTGAAVKCAALDAGAVCAVKGAWVDSCMYRRGTGFTIAFSGTETPIPDSQVEEHLSAQLQLLTADAVAFRDFASSLPKDPAAAFRIRTAVLTKARACAACDQEATLMCQYCSMPYCGRACQRSDWSAHKLQCFGDPQKCK